MTIVILPISPFSSTAPVVLTVVVLESYSNGLIPTSQPVKKEENKTIKILNKIIVFILYRPAFSHDNFLQVYMINVKKCQSIKGFLLKEG